MWKVKIFLINSFQIVNLKFCTISPVIGKMQELRYLNTV